MDDLYSGLDRLMQLNDYAAKKELASDIKTGIGRLLIELSKAKSQTIQLLEERSLTPDQH